MCINHLQMTLELFFWLSSSFSWLNFYVTDWMTKLSTHSLRWQSILGKNPVSYFIKLTWNDREKAKWLIDSPKWAFSHHFARFLKLLPELLKMMLLDCSVWACTVWLFLLFQNYLQSWQYKIMSMASLFLSFAFFLSFPKVFQEHYKFCIIL